VPSKSKENKNHEKKELSSKILSKLKAIKGEDDKV
jgi:hypothetical protein